MLKPPSDVEIMETQTATLECEVSKPNQTSKWLKEGTKEVKDGGRFEIRVDGTKHSLVIKDAELGDQAEYTVVIADKSAAAKVFVGGMSHLLTYSNCSDSLFLVQRNFN